MTRSSVAILILCFLISCNNGKTSSDGKDSLSNKKADSTSSKMMSYYTIDGDSLIIPSFDIQISLSPKAEQRMKGKETIIVSAVFLGGAKDTASTDGSGEFNVAYAERELSDSRVATFSGVKLSKKAYDKLADNDIQVLINVFSGRKSSKSNLLDCSILQEKMSVVKGKSFTITGKLIEGDD